MSLYTLVRIGVLTIFALILGTNLCSLDAKERENDLPKTQKRYQPFVGMMLPFLLLVWAGAELLLAKRTAPDVLRHLMATSSLVLLHMTVYYALLLPLLPWLRRHISARTCGFLWLAPNFLYLTFYTAYQWNLPQVVFHPPTALLPLLGTLWLAVSALLLLGSIVSHLRFRRKILRDAVPEQDPAVLEIWQAEQRRAGFRKAPYRLLRSPAVRTPLSIGLVRPTIRVLLPERQYSPEELPLVLRHELVHIGRADACSKLFLTLCAALFWFNPLMWIACRRSAEDFELSCDETVLLDADASTRRRYAELLLTTGGEQRGFTTCLSASAQSLRYRLKSVMAPAKRSLGAVVMMAAILLLILPFGTVTYAWSSGTAGEWVFAGDPVSCTISNLSFFDADGNQEHVPDVPDPEPLLEALGQLPVEELAGMYQLSPEEDPTLFLHCTVDGTPTEVILTGATLSVSCPHTARSRRVYHLSQAPDWDAIQSLLPKS